MKSRSVRFMAQYFFYLRTFPSERHWFHELWMSTYLNLCKILLRGSVRGRKRTCRAGSDLLWFMKRSGIQWVYSWNFNYAELVYSFASLSISCFNMFINIIHYILLQPNLTLSNALDLCCYLPVHRIHPSLYNKFIDQSHDITLLFLVR